MGEKKPVRFEQMQDIMADLYPELHANKKSYSLANGDRILSRTVTFQVTDDCNLACFPKDTKILMSDYTYKNIQDIRVGDTVIGFDEDKLPNKQRKINPTKVVHMFKRHDTLMKITTDKGDVVCTKNHPFLVRNKWVRAEDLKVGSMLCRLINFDAYEDTPITNIEYFDSNDLQTVYNFETESHTYIANNFFVHNCKYCYQINKGKRRMSFETAKKFIDMLLDCDESCTYINPTISPFIILEFIGGEPFLEVELIDKIMTYWKHRTIELRHPWATRYFISICSNGVLYKEPKVQEFLQKYKNKLSFSVTLDGNKELHDSCRIFPDGRGSYDLAVSAAKDWISRGNYMGSKITISPDNITHVYDAIKHMIDLGYNEINANCVYEKGWNEKHANELYKQMKKLSDYILDNDLEDDLFISLYEKDFFHPKEESDLDLWCGGDGMMLSCDPDGYLYPCIRFMESSLGDDVPPIRIGSVDTGIGSTKQECDRIHCVDCITRRTMSNDECFFCPIAEGCSWCAAYNFQDSGKLDSRATYYCIMHKARSLANAYYWNKYYKKKRINKTFKIYCPKEWALSIISNEEYCKLKEAEQ